MKPQKLTQRLTLTLSLLAVGPLSASAQDLVITDMGSDFEGRSFEYYGEAFGVLSYNFTTTISNIGTEPVAIGDPDSAHPVIGQSLFRIMDGRIEQIGQGMAKHRIEPFLHYGGCSDPLAISDHLSPGCSETYSAFYPDYGPDGIGYDEDGPKYQVNPTTGSLGLPILYPPCADSWLGDKVSHIEVDPLDIDPFINDGAVFLAEAQVISADDALAGNSANNVSIRLLAVNATDDVQPVWGTGQGASALDLFAAMHSSAMVTEVVNEDEGGSGVDSRVFVACNVIELPNGLYRYEYAVQNVDSHQGVRSLRIPADCAYLQLSDFDQHHVDYNLCGEIWQSDDWSTSLTEGILQFATGVHTGLEATEFSWDNVPTGDPSPIRWGTLSNFAFTATTPPKEIEVELGLFRPGSTMSLTAVTLGPCEGFECSTKERYCAGVPNSLGTIAAINSQGSTSVSQNNLILYCNSIPANQWGIFFYGPEELQHPLGGGTLCIGGAVFRINPAVQANENGLAMQFTDLTKGPMASGPGEITPGSTWNFQYWYRDPSGPTYSGFNFTDALRIHFCE